MASSPTLHNQILNDLESRIVSGSWPPGFRLPFEVELAKSYNVSRMTVNKVLTKLAEAGLIERRRKRGSFVATPRVQAAILEIHDIETEVQQLNCSYHFQLLHSYIRKAYPTEYHPFELETIAPVDHLNFLEVSCLHFAQNMPFCHEARLINLENVPQAVEVDFNQISPGKWLQAQVPWSRAEHKIYAIGADEDLAKLLKLAPHAPCLVVQRRTWNSQPLEPGDLQSASSQSTSNVVTFVRFTYTAEKHAVIARFSPAA